MESLGEEDVGGDSGLHGEFKNTTVEAVEVCLVVSMRCQAY
jgi:hypothetical protein